MRIDYFTGGDYYWIAFHNGRHCVRRAELEENVTEFTGTLNECMDYMNNVLEMNVDYDLNL